MDAQNRRALSRQSAEFKKGSAGPTRKRIGGVPKNR